MGGAYKGSWAVAITALSLLSVCLVLVIVKQDTFQERVQFSGHMTASQGAHSQHRLAVQAVGAEPGSAPKAKPRRESKTKAQMAFSIGGRGPRVLGRGYIVTGHDLSGDSGLSFPSAINKEPALKAECLKACEANTLCAAYTYHPSEARCFLKSGIDGVGGETCGTDPSCWFWGEVTKNSA